MGFVCFQEDNTAGSGCFEDEETRLFYESLPDLRAVVPGVLLGINSVNDRADSDIMVHDDAKAFDEPEAYLNGDMQLTGDSQGAHAEAGGPLSNTNPVLVLLNNQKHNTTHIVVCSKSYQKISSTAVFCIVQLKGCQSWSLSQQRLQNGKQASRCLSSLNGLAKSDQPRPVMTGVWHSAMSTAKLPETDWYANVHACPALQKI